jgi:hypothetical protein
MALGNKTPAEYRLQVSTSPVAQGKNATENLRWIWTSNAKRFKGS